MNGSPKLKVLMFGWEFSPFIAGGLGVVCKALTTSLTNISNTEITYVLPRIPNYEALSFSGVYFKDANVDESLAGAIRLAEIDSGLISPYISTELFNKQMGKLYRNTDGIASHDNDLQNPELKKIYNANLFAEVEAYAEQASDLAAEEDYDVIHHHDWMTAPAARMSKEQTGKPVVMHVHATEYERTLGNPNPYIFEKEVEGMQNADKIIAVSQLTKDRIVANYGIEADKIIVVHNAVEKVENKFGPIAKSIYKDDHIVLFLARLTAMKGADYLLQAAQEVIKVVPNTKFLFVGDGELLESLVEMSVDLGIAHKVTFTGFLPHDQVDRAYRFADVFVMPSIQEPFGITPLEAIKNGTPVILSKQSGVSEVLQNVLKVDFWDTKEMANKLIAVLRHGVLSEELVNNSKRDLESLNWDKQSEKVLKIYGELKDNLNLNQAT